nr:hypothetical protein [Mycobacterium sp.]
MGHASIVVTAHAYADLYDFDLDRVARGARRARRLTVAADKRRIVPGALWAMDRNPDSGKGHDLY